MRKLLLTTIAATMLASAGVANSATQSLGKIETGSVQSFISVLGKGSFTDMFKFKLDANSGSMYSVKDYRELSGYNVRFDGVSLLSNPDGIPESGDEALAFTTYSSSGIGQSFAMGSLAAGKYYLKVWGEALGSNGGVYSGAIAVPVPEPESYAMMLVGLGLMATIARRRSKAKAV